MSSCKAYSISISRYVDHDLDAREAKNLEEHLARCDRCRTTLQAFRAMKQRVGLALDHEPVIYGSLKRAPWEPDFSVVNHPAFWKLAALLVVAVAAGIGTVFHGSRTPPKIPIIIQSESARLFNTPLGALIYYENLNGTTIHTQYSKIDTALQLAGADAADGKVSAAYSSDLFKDSSYVAGFYSILRD